MVIVRLVTQFRMVTKGYRRGVYVRVTKETWESRPFSAISPLLQSISLVSRELPKYCHPEEDAFREAKRTRSRTPAPSTVDGDPMPLNRAPKESFHDSRLS